MFYVLFNLFEWFLNQMCIERYIIIGKTINIDLYFKLVNYAYCIAKGYYYNEFLLWLANI